jgi:hypothetical protein
MEKKISIDSNPAPSIYVSVVEDPTTTSSREFLVSPPCEEDKNEIVLGTRVFADYLYTHGVVRWIGILHPRQGIFAGIELAGPYGTCDGEYNGIRLFTCPENHGTFLPLADLKPVSSGSPKALKSIEEQRNSFMTKALAHRHPEDLASLIAIREKFSKQRQSMIDTRKQGASPGFLLPSPEHSLRSSFKSSADSTAASPHRISRDKGLDYLERLYSPDDSSDDHFYKGELRSPSSILTS